MSARERDKEREQFLHALEQTTRALSGNPKLKVVLGNSMVDAPTGDVVLPDLPPRATSRDMRLVRGFADRAAFLRRYGSSDMLLDVFAGASAPATKAVSEVEAARVELMGMRHYPGTHPNLATLGAMEARAYALRESPDVPLSYIISLGLRQKLGQKLDDVQEDILKLGEERLNPELAKWLKNAPQRIAQDSTRPEAYKELLKLLGLMDEQEQEQEQEDPSAQDKDAENTSDGGGDDSEDAPNDGESETGDETEMEAAGQDSSPDESEAEEGDDASTGAKNQSGTGVLKTYRPYTTQFDRIATARDMVTGAELQRLRERYKAVTAGNRRIVAKLSAKLQRYLVATTETGWKMDQEEGLIDPAKLTQLVV